MKKIESLDKNGLIEFCKNLGIETKKKTKSQMTKDVHDYYLNEISDAVAQGKGLELLTKKIEDLANEYSKTLRENIDARKEEMLEDDNSHYLIYRVLGIGKEEGRLIDEYQNTGRFLYKYAGSFLEEAASLCFQFNNLGGGKTTVENNQGQKPKTFEIDFLDNQNAFEIKWRDATTDGDHITKEHTRVKAIQSHGYKPIRVMFYYPQRGQAKKIQETLRTLYAGAGGEYYGGDAAWDYILAYTGYDLKAILTSIADKKDPQNGIE